MREAAGATAQPPRGRAGWSRAGTIWLIAVVVVLLASGVLLHELNPANAPQAADWGESTRGWLHASSVLHGVFAWAFCILLGRWVWPHVALVWAARRRWIWLFGIGVAGSGGIAALTGLMLLYGNADWRESMSAAHWIAGLFWPVLCVVHGWRRLRPGPRAGDVHQTESVRARAESGSPNTRSNIQANTKV